MNPHLKHMDVFDNEHVGSKPLCYTPINKFVSIDDALLSIGSSDALLSLKIDTWWRGSLKKLETKVEILKVESH